MTAKSLPPFSGGVADREDEMWSHDGVAVALVGVGHLRDRVRAAAAAGGDRGGGGGGRRGSTPAGAGGAPARDVEFAREREDADDDDGEAAGEQEGADGLTDWPAAGAGAAEPAAGEEVAHLQLRAAMFGVMGQGGGS